MKLIVEKDYEELSRRASEILVKEIQDNHEIVLGLATGSTPKRMYELLIEEYKKGSIDFSEVQTFNLDEYIGLSEDNPKSYNYYMQENLFNHINIIPENTHIPNGKAMNLESYCKEYEDSIKRAGGIDVQILGIGTDGHIGFNEPANELEAETCVVNLSESTIKANSRFFASDVMVPREAITMGVGSILKAKKIILLANGEKKRNVIKDLLEKPIISTHLPVSLLRLHPNVTIIVDEEAYEGEK